MARPKKPQAAPKSQAVPEELPDSPEIVEAAFEQQMDEPELQKPKRKAVATPIMGIAPPPPPALIEDLIVEAPSGFTIIREPHSWKVVFPVGGHPRYGIGLTLREALADAGLR